MPARKPARSKSPVRNAFYAQSGGVTAVINASAAGVIEACRKHGIEIHDLYSFVQAQQDRIMLPANVHFTKDGYDALAQDVVRVIQKALPAN